jgi:hypothetical protein
MNWTAPHFVGHFTPDATTCGTITSKQAGRKIPKHKRRHTHGPIPKYTVVLLRGLCAHICGVECAVSCARGGAFFGQARAAIIKSVTSLSGNSSKHGDDSFLEAMEFLSPADKKHFEDDEVLTFTIPSCVQLA